MPHDEFQMESYLIAVLETLATESAVKNFDGIIADAELRGTESARLEYIKLLELKIQSRLDRCKRNEAGLSALLRFAHELTIPPCLNLLLQFIARKARLLLGLDVAYVSLLDEAQESITVCAADGHNSKEGIGTEIPLAKGLDHAALDRLVSLTAPACLTDDLARHSTALRGMIKDERLESMIAVPLISRGSHKSIGTLYVAARKMRHFTPEEISLMNHFGRLAEIAVENSQKLNRVTSEKIVSQERVRELQTQLDGMIELNERAGLLFKWVHAGGDLESLTEEAGRLIDSPLLLCASDGAVLARAGDMQIGDEAALAEAALQAHTALRPVRLDDGMWAAPIHPGHENLGTLFLRPDRPFTDRDEFLLRAIVEATVAMLRMHHRIGADVGKGEDRDELLDDLLTASQQPSRHSETFPHQSPAVAHHPMRHLERRALRIGVDLSAPHVVVVAHPEGTETLELSTTAAWSATYARSRDGLQTINSDGVVLLLPGTDAGALAQEVSDNLSAFLGRPVTVGAAGPVSAPYSITSRYREALRCLDTMTTLGTTKRAASMREMGFLGLVLSDDVNIDAFIDATIGSVLDSDRELHTDLVNTLAAYFATSGSPTRAANSLHVHPNTVVRRLTRIGELLGPRWKNPEQALDIQLAIKLSRVQRIDSKYSSPTV